MDLTNGQFAVLRALKTLTAVDDIGLAVYVQHIADVGMSSSGVRTRRNELQHQGLVEIVSIKKLKSGRNAAVHGLTKKGKDVLRANRRVKVASVV